MSGPQVLIVDSDARSRRRMAGALRAAGYRVAEAAGAFEGLRRFGSGDEVDLALVDQRLREMDGLAALAWMRERDPTARLVLVAEAATVRLAAEATAAGASGFLVKECTAALLCQAVRGCLAVPREPASHLEMPLAALLPIKLLRATPLFRIRTLNGFTFWRLSGPEEEGEPGEGIGRAYCVRALTGERCHCEVQVDPRARAAVAAELGRDLPAADLVWDALCQLALSDTLLASGALPPPMVALRTLTGDQQLVLREAAARQERAYSPTDSG